MTHQKPLPVLLTPGEVALLLRVHPKTVTRWAHGGKLSPTFTLGGHRRFWTKEILQVLVEGGATLDEAQEMLRWVVGGGRG